jgi:drug/metabolite transporter (DMT)-like permease
MVFMKVITGALFDLLTGAAGAAATFFSSVDTYLCFGTSILSFVALQIGLRYGQAVLVVSSYQSALVFSPTLIALFVLGEPVRWAQWLCLAVIVAGVALTTLSRREV